MLALGRAIREIEAFPDQETRSRMARYLADRFPALERFPPLETRAPGPLDRQPGETVEQHAARLWDAPLDGPLGQVPVDPRQESLALLRDHDRPENPPIAVKLCAHGSLLGENCFGCEAERQVAKDRHSAPPVPAE